MSKGLFDDVPIINPDRDRAWERIIKRKDMKAMMKNGKGFEFPLDNSYSLWCIAWSIAYDKAFKEGWSERGKFEKEKQ